MWTIEHKPSLFIVPLTLLFWSLRFVYYGPLTILYVTSMVFISISNFPADTSYTWEIIIAVAYLSICLAICRQLEMGSRQNFLLRRSLVADNIAGQEQLDSNANFGPFAPKEVLNWLVGRTDDDFGDIDREASFASLAEFDTSGRANRCNSSHMLSENLLSADSTGERKSIAGVGALLSPMPTWEVDFALLNMEDTPFARGANGQIFKGRYLAVDVAIKELYVSRMNHTELHEFSKEAAMLYQLSHPNIVRFFGITKNNLRTYLVTQYVENTLSGCLRGDSFRQEGLEQKSGDTVMKAGAPKFELSLERKLSLAMSICDAMVYLHSRNCLHRDLKPENVLLSGDCTHVYLCDFGLATLQNDRGNRSTADAIFVGTPQYMAPELARDQGTERGFFALASADVYGA
jgi:tRNA A-37 threonylcarbamoyl transferase component Bud32